MEVSLMTERYNSPPQQYDNTQSELIVSSKNIKDCSQIIDTLSKSGIKVSVSENNISHYDNRGHTQTKGCSIIMDCIKPEKVEKFVWKPLQKEYELDSAQMIIKKKTFFGF